MRVVQTEAKINRSRGGAVNSLNPGGRDAVYLTRTFRGTLRGGRSVDDFALCFQRVQKLVCLSRRLAQHHSLLGRRAELGSRLRPMMV
jgi:hypothetical protein